MYNNIKRTKYYLKNYRILQLTLKNMVDKKTELELKYQENPYAPIVKYEPSGGYSELNQIESTIYNKDKIINEIEVLKKRINILQDMLEKIMEAIEALSNNEQYLIKGFYFQKKKWAKLAKDLYISEKWAKAKGNKALKTITIIISGELSTGGCGRNGKITDFY